MIAKLIVAAADREEVLARAERALAEFDIEGLRTVIPFHRLMLDDDTFRAGTHTTKYLDQDSPTMPSTRLLHDGGLTRSVATPRRRRRVKRCRSRWEALRRRRYGRTGTHRP